MACAVFSKPIRAQGVTYTTPPVPVALTAMLYTSTGVVCLLTITLRQPALLLVVFVRNEWIGTLTNL